MFYCAVICFPFILNGSFYTITHVLRCTVNLVETVQCTNGQSFVPFQDVTIVTTFGNGLATFVQHSWVEASVVNVVQKKFQPLKR